MRLRFSGLGRLAALLLQHHCGTGVHDNPDHAPRPGMRRNWLWSSPCLQSFEFCVQFVDAGDVLGLVSYNLWYMLADAGPLSSAVNQHDIAKTASFVIGLCFWVLSVHFGFMPDRKGIGSYV